MSAVTERTRKAGAIETEICRLYDASVYEVWETPRLHIAFIQDKPSFWNSFHSAKKYELEATDALGEDLLCLAALNGNLELGIFELPYAPVFEISFTTFALFTDIKIINMLLNMEILVTNIEEILGSPCKGSTSIDLIKYRRFSNLECSSQTGGLPDKNPSEIYYAFKALVRNIFKRSTGKDATFRYDGEHWIAVAVEESDEDTISEDEFSIEEVSDAEEEGVVHRIDTTSSEDDQDDGSSTHGGDDDGDEEEIFEDAPESLTPSVS
ncbi:MAG: hypothetical protein Q9213_003205 [Squamulea squamosa]